MKARFLGTPHEVIFTRHAKLQMSLREISEQEVLNVIETGNIKPKDHENKFWVYKELKGRKDNLISISISVEPPKLIIVITTLINWRPQ